jgi:hypothetical protein
LLRGQAAVDAVIEHTGAATKRYRRT